jgi:hypothetical protein
VRADVVADGKKAVEAPRSTVSDLVLMAVQRTPCSATGKPASTPA